MKALKLLFRGISYIVVIQMVQCTLPAEVDPVRWQMYVELPVVDEKYTVSEVLPENLFSGLDVAFGDGSVSGDTVSVLKKGTISANIRKQLLYIDTTEIEKRIGVFTLGRIPPMNVDFLFKSIVTDDNIYGQPLPMSMRLQCETERSIDGVVSLTVDESSSPLNVTVVNNGERADLENVVIVLSHADDTIAEIHVAEIAALSTKIVPVPLAGKSIHFPLRIHSAFTLPAGTYLQSSDALGLSFPLNEQKISEAVLNDTLLDYSNMFDGELKIADSIRVHSIDLHPAVLEVEISCPDLMKVEVGGCMENCWDIDFSKRYDLESEMQLAGISDSTGVAGVFPTDTLLQSTAGTFERTQIHIPPVRIFPSWNPKKNAAFLTYHFRIKSLPEGRLVRLRKNDRFIFRVYSPAFPFECINGCLMKKNTFSFSENIKAGFNWKAEITDSLKKKLHFEKTGLQMDLTSDLPPGSVLDSVMVNISMYEKGEMSDTAMLVKKFTNVRSGTRHSALMDITDLFNTWPDTIIFNAEFVLPNNTELTLFNTDNWRSDFQAPTEMKMDLNWSLLVPLCWNVDDTVRVELDKTMISLPSDKIDWVEKLQDPRIRMQMKVLNHTNISFTLHGLGTCGRNKGKLLSMPFPGKSIRSDPDENLFSLFDENGLEVAAYGEEKDVELLLDKKGVSALLSPDSCLIRWFLSVPSRKTGALLATDFFRLQVKSVIEGVADTDSLQMNTAEL